jgi:hypothetical protein
MTPNMYVLWRKIVLNNQIICHRTLSMTVIHLVVTTHFMTGGAIRQVISLCTYFHIEEALITCQMALIVRGTTYIHTFTYKRFVVSDTWC